MRLFSLISIGKVSFLYLIKSARLEAASLSLLAFKGKEMLHVLELYINHWLNFVGAFIMEIDVD